MPKTFHIGASARLRSTQTRRLYNLFSKTKKVGPSKDMAVQVMQEIHDTKLYSIVKDVIEAKSSQLSTPLLLAEKCCLFLLLAVLSHLRNLNSPEKQVGTTLPCRHHAVSVVFLLSGKAFTAAIQL